MPAKVKPIPEGFHTLTPHIVVNDANKAIEFYKKAFGAEEISRMPAPDGTKVMHAELQIGSSRLMLNDEIPGMGPRSAKTLGGSAVVIHLYVKDADATFEKAVAAGAKPTMPVQDTFWGDRYGALTDPFGHMWSVATHKEDVTPREIARRAEKQFSKPKE